MTLVSTIGFSYTHHLVHYPETILDTSDSRNQNGGNQTNKIGNRGGVGSQIEYHMSQEKTYLYLLVIIPLPCHGLLVAIYLSNDRHLGI